MDANCNFHQISKYFPNTLPTNLVQKNLMLITTLMGLTDIVLKHADQFVQLTMCQRLRRGQTTRGPQGNAVVGTRASTRGTRPCL